MILRTLKAAILLSFIANTRTDIFVHIDGMDSNPIVIDQDELDNSDGSKNVGDLKEAVETQLKIQDPAKLNLEFGGEELSDSTQLLADAGIAMEAVVRGKITIKLQFYHAVRELQPVGVEVNTTFNLEIPDGQDIFDTFRNELPEIAIHFDYSKSTLSDLVMQLDPDSPTQFYPTVSGNQIVSNALQSFENADLLLTPEGQEPLERPTDAVSQYNVTNCNDHGVFKSRPGATAVLFLFYQQSFGPSTPLLGIFH